MLRCPGCGLDNPDHARRCARCGGLLHLPENVIPPRARRGLHPKRLLYALRRRCGFRWRQPEARPISAGLRNTAEKIQVLPWRTIFPALVPSLFQFTHKRPIRGWIYLCCFVLGLLGVWALPGTQYFYWAIWLVVLAQVWSLADAIPWQGDIFLRLGKANLFGIVLFIALAMLYVRLADRVFDALGLIQVGPRYAAGPLRYGMYCRIVPQKTYRPGDVVAYRSGDIAGYLPGGIFAFYIRQIRRQYIEENSAAGIDRILAAGPAELAVEEGILTVDGSPSPIRPLQAIELVGKFNRRLPEGNFCIIPGGVRLQFANQEYFARLIFRPQEDILGRVEIRFPRWERTGGLL